MRYLRLAICFFRVLILSASFGMRAVYAAPFAYISNVGDGTVSVIDTATNTVVATVPVGVSPIGVAVNPAGTFAYVANTTSNNVSVIDTGSNTVVATVPAGSAPYGVAVNPAGTFAYVTNTDTNVNTVSVINTATNTLVATVPVGSGPTGVAVTGAFAYVANTFSYTVSVINTSTNTVVATVPVGSDPKGVAINTTGTFAYVSNYLSNNVSVIDTSSNTVVQTIPVGSAPYGVAVNPAGTLVYVTNNNSNSVSVINTGNNNVVATVPVGTNPSGVAVNPAGTFAYVANEGTGNIVSVINTATNTVVATVQAGTVPVAFGNFIGPAGRLGDSSNLVYKALEPCRIMDTRNAATGSGVQGPITGGSLKQIPGFITAGSNWSIYGQTGTPSDCGLTNPPGSAIHAVAIVITILNPNFDAFFGVGDVNDLSTTLSTVALNYTHGQGLSTLYIVPQVAGNVIYFALPAGLSANLIFDVVGYHILSDATSLQCTTQTFAPSLIGASGGTGSAMSTACDASYALTSGSCDSDSLAMKLVTAKAAGQAWFCSATNTGGTDAHLTATANCCRVPGR